VQVSVEKSGPCEAEVSFSVPRADFDREYQAALRASSKNVRLKGFRPGKVPAKILEKELGPQVRQHAIEHFVSRAYDQAVSENELQPVGHERIDVDSIELAEGQDLSHSFRVSLRPEFELGEYKGLEVQSELAPVLDQELDDAIADLRMQRSTPSALPEGEGLPEDGQALCHLEWLVDGEAILDREGLRLSPLVPPPGVDGEAFKAAMAGKAQGDTFELEMTVPEDFQDEEKRGAAGTCRVTLGECFQLTPPSDEELWELLGVASKAEFDEKARERLSEAKEQQENQRQETVLLEGLIDAHDFELPGMMVENQVTARKNQYAQQLMQGGVPAEELEAKVEESAAEIEEATRKSIRALFLVEGIAQKEELKVEEQDFQREVQAIAARHGAPVEAVVEHYQKNNLFPQLQIELLERKVRAFLRENAKITEP
jgi:trigger factor